MSSVQATAAVEVERGGMEKATPAAPSSSDWLCFVGSQDGIAEARALKGIAPALPCHFGATSPQFCYTIVTRTCNAMKKVLAVRFRKSFYCNKMRETGLEPARVSPLDPKSSKFTFLLQWAWMADMLENEVKQGDPPISVSGLGGTHSGFGCPLLRQICVRFLGGRHTRCVA